MAVFDCPCLRPRDVIFDVRKYLVSESKRKQKNKNRFYKFGHFAVGNTVFSLVFTCLYMFVGCLYLENSVSKVRFKRDADEKIYLSCVLCKIFTCFPKSSSDLSKSIFSKKYNTVMWARIRIFSYTTWVIDRPGLMCLVSLGNVN